VAAEARYWIALEGVGQPAWFEEGRQAEGREAFA
jgi:hypothetical protein